MNQPPGYGDQVQQPQPYGGPGPGQLPVQPQQQYPPQQMPQQQQQMYGSPMYSQPPQQQPQQYANQQPPPYQAPYPPQQQQLPQQMYAPPPPMPAQQQYAVQQPPPQPTYPNSPPLYPQQPPQQYAPPQQQYTSPQPPMMQAQPQPMQAAQPQPMQMQPQNMRPQPPPAQPQPYSAPEQPQAQQPQPAQAQHQTVQEQPAPTQAPPAAVQEQPRAAQPAPPQQAPQAQPEPRPPSPPSPPKPAHQASAAQDQDAPAAAPDADKPGEASDEGAAAATAAAVKAAQAGSGKRASFAADTSKEAADPADDAKTLSVKGTVKEVDSEAAEPQGQDATEASAKDDKKDNGDEESGEKASKSKKKQKEKEEKQEDGKKGMDEGDDSGHRKKSKSKSPSRRKSKSPSRRKSKSPSRRRSKSPGRRKSKSPSRKKSKSPSRKKSKSPSRRKKVAHREDDYSDDFESSDPTSSERDAWEARGRQHQHPYNDSSSFDSRGAGSYDEPRLDDRPRYQGDVSEWGRERVPGFYQQHGSASSDYTLSSGLSPRDQDGKTHREFDIEEAKNTFAYNAGLFGRAQTLRKAGQAPKTLGIADDLPDRFAFHQLEQLAGMARKVQDAIEHNKRVFQKRVEQEDLMVKKKAFNGWRAARYGTLAKQQLLKRVLMRMQRFRLAKAFFAWKDKFGEVDKNWAMRRKLQSTICRGRLRRCFDGWRKVLMDRWWKNQLETRDSRIHALEQRISGFELRPIIVLKRRMLSAVLTAWYNLSDERRRRRMRFERAAKHFMNRQLGMAWNSWFEYHLECKRRADILKRAALRMKNIKLSAAWNKWMDLILAKKEHMRKMGRALGHWKNRGIAKAWDTWWQHVLWRREKKKIIARWKQPLKAKAFYTWVDWVAWRNRMRVIMDRTAKRILNSCLAKAWDAWRAAFLDSRMDFHMTKKEELALQVKALTEENERLRRDNERFVRLIDSGEWGRGRVAELVSAGEVLKGERDALMKLIQSMRKEYESVQAAKGAQDDELRRLKERMLLGGAARNKMLVKGASSYNALKRAIKQDLVEAGAVPSSGVQDPNLLYEIDKLSMDRVAVFPDGDLNIEAVSTARASAAFARPVGAVQGMRSSAAPAYPVQVPQGLLNLGAGRAGAAGPSSRLPANSRSSERVVQILNRLQSLTPAEIDRVEERLRAEAMARMAAGAPGPSGVGPSDRGPAGMSSSARR